MRRHLSNAYEPSRRLSDAYDHNLKKKINFVIFGRFKRKNPRAIGSNRRILDRNVVMEGEVDLNFVPANPSSASLGASAFCHVLLRLFQ